MTTEPDDPLDLVDYTHTWRSRQLLSDLDAALLRVLEDRAAYEDKSTEAIHAEARYRESVAAADAAQSALRAHMDTEVPR